MKLRTKISKIKCLRTSKELSVDEIYGAFILLKARIVDNEIVPIEGDNPEWASDIKKKVKKETLWQPAENEAVFDLGNDEVFALQFLLCEADNKKFYKDLQDPDKKAALEGFDLSGVEIPDGTVSGDGSIDWTKVVEVAIQFLTRLFKHLREDDILGVEPFAYHIGDENLSIPKSFVVKHHFAHYEVIIELGLSH